MATLSENITNTITYLDEIRDAILYTTIDMPKETIVADYSEGIKKLIPIILTTNTSSINFNAPASSKNLTITCNTTGKLSVPTGVTVSSLNGTGNKTIIVSVLENNTDIKRTGEITITAKDVLTKKITINQEKETGTVKSYTCTANPTSCIYEQSSESDTGTGNGTVTINSFQTEVSDLNNTKYTALLPEHSESLPFITNVSKTLTSSTQYTVVITYNKSISGSGIITFSNQGKSCDVVCTIKAYEKPVNEKSMTLRFNQTGIQSAFLFKNTVSNMQLSTTGLKPETITNNSIILTWEENNGITINTETGSQMTIREGETFVVYYATALASHIGGYRLSISSYTLKNNTEVTI